MTKCDHINATRCERFGPIDVFLQIEMSLILQCNDYFVLFIFLQITKEHVKSQN